MVRKLFSFLRRLYWSLFVYVYVLAISEGSTKVIVEQARMIFEYNVPIFTIVSDAYKAASKEKVK